ncbi:PIG-L family deacetylase [Pseudomonas sp. 10B1]|uniref:PIG-L deacetylase family protein n=1 Tax=unclassified Pseudomonas TaxID=196821 RepID=UPI002AB50F8D|nr:MULTISPECIES: PIG-L family deacetylase [unclassified Pseudomonas]MDY7563073.1 PIG-L family deacetylase [Pseudomonas sp. AB6]MEA9976229.1 PIG-L family deacetylase [Pseudomonas sp. RTS4]MEA9993843.1 PIG-L family deacetylase [Pseudomonas sp. AA4]MEB0085184.1 PIG-L family deacetylase [Pseudomonas sp. RTI1]MEB0125287.1 PIG-L family deacetylase [Pseudomonas sp. CCC1.2]
MNRKQQLLKRHRRNKRAVLLIGLLLLVVIGILVAWWLPLLLAVLAWVAHEAWFADHLFYSPKDDYHYRFPDDCEQPNVRLEGEFLQVGQPLALTGDETLVLGLRIKSSWIGRFLDPAINLLGTDLRDQQAFERGVDGLRYLNLTGLGAALADGSLRVRGRFCRLQGLPRLWVFRHTDVRRQRVMVIAPHADDAELAAFGLYSQAAEAWIVTLTAGEIEAEHYRQMGMQPAEAARVKGRLRAWDSVAVPRWGGVPEAHCVQLGYFCLQLPAMQAAPEQPIASREAELSDTRLFRQFNPMLLPGDSDGAPTWNNLLADLRALLLTARPQVLVMPHPSIDPHPDHICAQAAVLEALHGLEWQPQTILGYANHLYDNDRWPMGNAYTGVSLPPYFAGVDLIPYSLELSASAQRDKAMALGMMHDLQPLPPFKRRVRRWLQQLLAGRRWPAEGENEFFRKAVRRHELFWRKDH